MIDQDELISVAETELDVTLTERQKAGLIVLHEWYFKRLKEKRHITASELREQCSNVVLASEKFLKAIKKPLPILYDNELLRRELMNYVRAYKDHAKELFEHFEPSTMKKRWAKEGRTYKGPRGKRENWPLHMYVRELAQWYEELTENRASGALRAVFVRLLYSHASARLNMTPTRSFQGIS
jgi:hypothetical protein